MAGAGPGILVGRGSELAGLDTALAAAADGDGATVLVAGEAGIGKSRLIRECAGRAESSGFDVLLGRCLDLVGTELPYQPVVAAVRPLRTLVAVDPPAAGSQLGFFEDTLALIATHAQAAPVLLVIEDVHWADTSTLDLLVFLGHHLAGQRVLLVATYRSDEAVSSARVRRFEDGVRRSGSVRMLRLEPLARDDLVALLSEHGGDQLPLRVTNSIVARSQGNPFFAEELLAAANGAAVPLPEGLRELLLLRVGRLGAVTQDLLRIAAAVGGEVAYSVIMDVAGVPESSVRQSLREAVDHAVLVVEARANGFRFRHALLAEAVYATLLPGEREDLHARIAARLTAAGAGPGVVAHHWAAAGRRAEALTGSVEAAREAELVFGLAEAHAHLERVIALWDAVPDPPERIGLDLVGVLAWAGRLASQIGAAPRAVELAQRAIDMVSPDEPERAARLHVQLGEYFHEVGRSEDLLAMVRRAVELLPAEPLTPERAYALSSLAGALMVAWRHADSLPVAEQALASAHAINSDEAVVRATTVVGVDLAYLGRADEGLARLREALRLAEDTGDRIGLDRAYVNITDVLTMLGQPGESARLARTGIDTLRHLGIHSTVLLANHLEALIAIGEWDDAEAISALALRSITGAFPYMLLMLRADLEVGRGDFQAAGSHLEQARATLRPDHGYGIYEIYTAELALWQRDWRRADRAATDALARCQHGETNQLRVWFCAKALRAQAELAALARARRDVAATRAWTKRAAALWSEAQHSARSASAITPNAAGWLALAEAEHTRAGGDRGSQPWQVAAATWDRLDRAPLAAYCRWREAEAIVLSGGARTDAARPLRRAYAVATRIAARPLAHELQVLAQRARLNPAEGPEATPSSHASLQHALGLTAREAEVLALLAQGRTNREIAHELRISEKTAGVHVSHILHKIDAGNRHQAATIAQQILPPPHLTGP